MTPEKLMTALDKLEKSFDKVFKETEPFILTKNQILKEALNLQVELAYKYERLLATADYLEKEAEALMEQYHGYAYTKHMQGAKRVLSSDAKKFADCNDDVVAATSAYNEIYKLRRNIQAIARVIETRGYSLKNQTDSIIAGVNGHVL